MLKYHKNKKSWNL